MICQALKTNSSLIRLDFQGENMTKEDKLLLFFTKTYKENRIGDEGCELMSEVLKTNSTLTELNLRCCEKQ